MAKALLFSDLHLHAHKQRSDRLHNCLEVLEWAFEKAVEKNCRYVLFLGDLFHERAKIDVLNYLRTFEVFEKYAQHDMDIYLLVGNHDMYHREHWDVNSVKPLTAYGNVHIVDKPSVINIGGRDVDFLPYTENPIKELASLKDAHPETLTLLLAHIAVHGAILNTLYGTAADVIVEHDTGMMPVDVSLFDDWTMTFLGHYHGAQELNKHVEYLGSPLQLSFGEAFQEKHIAVLDLDTLEKEYIVNDFSPKHFILNKDEISNYDLRGAFVRIVVDDISNKDLIDIKIDLLENKKVTSFDFKQREHEEADEIQIEEARAILFQQDEMLEKWMEEAGIPEGLTKDRLLQEGKKILAAKEDLC